MNSHQCPDRFTGAPESSARIEKVLEMANWPYTSRSESKSIGNPRKIEGFCRVRRKYFVEKNGLGPPPFVIFKGWEFFVRRTTENLQRDLDRAFPWKRKAPPLRTSQGWGTQTFFSVLLFFEITSCRCGLLFRPSLRISRAAFRKCPSGDRRTQQPHRRTFLFPASRYRSASP